MSDITREEAIKILKDTLYDERTPNKYIQAVRMGREALVNQKTGCWEEEEMYDGDVAYRCSECGEVFCLMSGTPIDNLYNYCPNCGARLESEE